MLSDSDGVQIVDVPAGIHVVEASFTNTPPRIAGTLLTAIGFLGVIGLVAADRRRGARQVREVAAPRRPASVGSFKQLAAIVSTLLIGVLVVFWFFGRGRSGSSPSGGATRPAAESRSQGVEATLHLDGAPAIFVSMNEQALNELLMALSARDSSKIEELAQSGQVLRVPNDTGVRILETEAGKTKVRVLQGEHLMAEGWVPERWIR
jgi:hypothetical protein